MLFPRNALASGPQACFLAGKRIAKVKVGKQEEYIDICMNIRYVYMYEKDDSDS
jgi:hypothetical protein